MMAIIIQIYLIYVDDYLGYSNTNKYEYLILQRCRKMKRIATRLWLIMMWLMQKRLIKNNTMGRSNKNEKTIQNKRFCNSRELLFFSATRKSGNNISRSLELQF